jgi:hypothetical protein
MRDGSIDIGQFGDHFAGTGVVRDLASIFSSGEIGVSEVTVERAEDWENSFWPLRDGDRRTRGD